MYTHGYQLRITDLDNNDWIVNIYNKNDFYSDDLPPLTPVYTFLEGSGDPLHISSDNNEENKFVPIRSTKVIIQLLATQAINLNTFILDAEDDQWYTETFKNNTLVHCGHLVLNDCSQAFLDDEVCAVTLTSSDGLPLLRNSKMTKPDGSFPLDSVTGNKFKLIEIISWCLRQTGHNLQINVVNNIIEQWFIPTQYNFYPLYDSLYAWIKTFEGDKVGECIDPYSVLERILGQECYLTQAYGQWWIRRIDEIQYVNDNMYIDQFHYEGTYFNSQIAPRITYAQKIGKTEGMSLQVPAALVTIDRRHGEIKETFNYEYPKEIVDNIDFSRGNLYLPLSMTDTDKKYHIDDWLMGRYEINSEIPGSGSAAIAYIQRILDGGYEKERYLVITYSGEGGGGTPFAYLRSNPIPVVAKDKFTASVDYRFQTLSGSTNYGAVFGFILKGDDGHYYALSQTGPDTTQWIDVTSFGSGTPLQWAAYSGTDPNNWNTETAEAAALPVDGELYIYLIAGYNNGGSGNPHIHYQNLRFDYIPYINGSYQKYTGQSNKVSQSGTLFAKIDQTVYISDSPRKLFKGALFKRNFEAGFTGTVVVTAPGTITLPGDQTALYSVGQKVKLLVLGPLLNTGLYTIATITFNGTNTIITVPEIMVNETVGADLLKMGNKFVLTDKFYDGSGGFRYAPTDEALHPLGHLQAYSVWNQYNRDMRLFDASVSSTGGDSEVPSPIYTYFLTDHSPHTYGKYFHLLHFDINCYHAQWSGFLAEVFDENIGHKYSDPLEFKYIEQR